MAYKISLEQKQTQTLVLSPQMQQAIYLLQLPVLELQQFLQQQLVQNPILEEVEDMTSSSSQEGTTDTPEKNDYESNIKDDMDRFAKLDSDWQGYIRGMGGFQGKPDPEYEKKRRFMEDSLTRGPSLQEHLISQLHISSSSPREEEIGEAIIGNIDSNGYLQVSVEELSQSLPATTEEIESVLSSIQTFEPSGVGAKNLQECLLIQLNNLGKGNSLEAKIIREYIKDLERKRFTSIARRLGIHIDKIVDAAKEISYLEPKPGRNFSNEKNHTIIPELTLKKVNGEYHILTNDSGLPQLRINPTYRKLMRKRETETAARKYLVEKFKLATWVIKSIEQRRKTIRRVAECIVKKQREFLDKGIQHLKPCTLGEIADEIGMHESTVSRVTTNKYIDTPQGIFELKFFFTGQIHTKDNGSVSSRSIREKIRGIIETENGKHPFSDVEISKNLSLQGIRIARRTVAKYRESMKILPSTLRKKY